MSSSSSLMSSTGCLFHSASSSSCLFLNHFRELCPCMCATTALGLKIVICFVCSFVSQFTCSWSSRNICDCQVTDWFTSVINSNDNESVNHLRNKRSALALCYW